MIMNNLKRNFTRNLAQVANTEARILELLAVGFSEVQNGNLDYLKASLAPFMTPKTNTLNAQGKRIVQYIHALYGHAVRIKAEKTPQETGFRVQGQAVLSPVSVRLVPKKRRGNIDKIVVNERELDITFSNLPSLEYSLPKSDKDKKPGKVTVKRLEAIVNGITENEYTADELAELMGLVSQITTAIGGHSKAIVDSQVHGQAPLALTSSMEGKRQAIAH